MSTSRNPRRPLKRGEAVLVVRTGRNEPLCYFDQFAYRDENGLFFWWFLGPADGGTWRDYIFDERYLWSDCVNVGDDILRFSLATGKVIA